MTRSNSQVYRVGELTLDLAAGRLWGPAGDVDLRAKSYALLAELAASAGQVVSKDALVNAVWPDVIVSDDSLTQAVHDLRRALGDDAHSILKTVPRRGYALDARTQPSSLTATEPVAIAHDGVAVLPFRGLQELTDRERLLLDGLAHDLTTGLAQLRAFRVTGRGSAFALRDMADDPALLRQRLGVSYVVTGTLLPATTGHRLQLDLIRTDWQNIVWTTEIALDLASINLVARPLTDRCAAAIATALTLSEQQRVSTLQDTELSAWEAFHVGLDMLFGITEATAEAALEQFAAAIRTDPGFARAHAYRSFCFQNMADSADPETRISHIAASLQAARDAVRCDGANPVARWALSRAHMLADDHEGGFREISQALTLCPSFPQAHYTMGLLQLQRGNALLALDHLAKFEDLSPVDPLLAAVQITRAMAYLRLGDLPNAAIWAARASHHRSESDPLQLNAALILAAAGHHRQASVAWPSQDKTRLHGLYANIKQKFRDMPQSILDVLELGLRRLAQ